ncbi:MAG: hypothetical protein LBJ01_00475 [Tannerella sp.]|jgi:hypothetical protein|nr:hypothetical protein [Tannerella sp.]
MNYELIMEKKHYLRKGFMALMFNAIMCMALSAATGFNAVALIAGGAALGVLHQGIPGGALGMAIQKELWMNHIVEGLFADNSFLSKAYSADMFVNAGRTVHIPNAGNPSGVEKNRSTKPASVNTRTDTDLTFDLDEFTTSPIYIPHADTVELSYNKRESILKQDKNRLAEVVSESFLYQWAPAKLIKTTGGNTAAHVPAGTGNRKALKKTDLLAAMTQFNTDNIPQEGRYVLLDAVMYSQLLEDLTANESQAFFAAADIKNGVIGKLYSFNIMMRSRALLYATAGTKKEWTATSVATDCAGALVWHVDSICRALGDVKAFENEGDPTWYGDIYSFLVRAGGRPMRADTKGLLAIVQDTPAA